MAFAGVLMLFLSLMPLYLKTALNVYIPAGFIYLGIAFIFASVFLGQFGGLYDRLPWYDALLHFISALAFGLAGFIILYIYYVHNKIRLPKSVLLFFAFFFCLGIGSLWEIIEYGIDFTFGTNMQVNSLDDTMSDLILNGLGAIVSITICSLYISKIHMPILESMVDAVTQEIVEENSAVAKTTTNDHTSSPVA